MSITLSGAAVFALSTYIQCVLNDTCTEPDPKPRVSRIELWASNETSPSSSLDIQIKGEEIRLDVPFTSQAPHQNWNSPYDEACEEASIVMAEYYLRGETLTPEKADMEIKALVSAETALGWGVDISAWQAGKIAVDVYGRDWRIYSGPDVTASLIKSLLSSGQAVIAPVSGQDLHNPNFRGAGPPYHMIVLTGYDADNFFAHDPGTQYGKNYVYPQATLMNALHDWTGSKATIREGQKAILVLQKTGIAGYVAAYGF